MYLSWFSKLIMIDGGIIDDTVKEFKDINTMLIEKNNYFIVVGYISNYNNWYLSLYYNQMFARISSFQIITKIKGLINRLETSLNAIGLN